MSFRFLPVLGLTLALPIAAHAQSSDFAADAPRDDATITVTALRTPQPIADTAQSVTILTADEIARRQSQSVVDLLRTVPGVSITRNGGPGTVAGVNIRGAEADQTVVLIDGVKLNDPSAIGGGFDFGHLLASNIDRIEVVRGSQSVIWGSQAIGGVVNLITRAPTDRPQLEAQGEYGFRNTSEAVGNLSGTLGPVAASAGAGWFRTDGISAFDEALGGTERDGYANFGAHAKLLVSLSDAVQVDLRGFYANGRTDVDGYQPDFSFGDTNENQRTREGIAYAGLNASAFGGKLKNRIAYALTRVDRVNRDPDGFTPMTFDGRGRNDRFEYQGVADLGLVDAVFGAETEKSSFRTASYGGPAQTADARLTSVYGDAHVAPVAGLTIGAGLRYDHHSQFGDATTFSASGVYSLASGTRIRASYGEGFKVPSLYQLYGDYGNTALTPERSKSWDAGIAQSLGGIAEVSATWFHRDTTNQIDFVSCPTQTGICVNRPYGTYDNIRLTRGQGVELQASLHPVAGLALTGQYSFIDATDRDTGLRLARRPRHTASLNADYRAPFGLDLGTTIAHVGDSFDDAGNSRRLDGYTLVDLRAELPVTKLVSVYGRIENLFDEQYETIYQYGTPGRAAYAGVRLRL